MKVIQSTIIGLFLLLGVVCNAQNLANKSDFEQITETLTDYIEGTANGEPERLKKAFHPSFNLFTVHCTFFSINRLYQTLAGISTTSY